MRPWAPSERPERPERPQSAFSSTHQIEYWPDVLKATEAGFHFARARTIQPEVHPEESLSGL